MSNNKTINFVEKEMNLPGNRLPIRFPDGQIPYEQFPDGRIINYGNPIQNPAQERVREIHYGSFYTQEVDMNRINKEYDQGGKLIRTWRG